MESAHFTGNIPGSEVCLIASLATSSNFCVLSNVRHEVPF